MTTTIDDARIGALIALLEADRPADAQAGAQALLEQHPQAGILLKILGVALVRQGKDALPVLRQAAALLPQDAEAQSNLGSALHDRGLWEEALVSLRRALTLQKNDVRALADAADALRALGRVAESVAVYQEALHLEPRQPRILNNLGNALLQLGHGKEAAAAYRHALAIEPRNAAIIFNLANALRQTGRFAEAIDFSRRALALDPTLALAHNNLGLGLKGLGRRDEAMASFRQALQMQPANADFLTNLGDMCSEDGLAREAADLYRRAIETDPGRVESHVKLGNAVLQYLPVQEASTHFQRALALDPTFPAAHRGLALVQRLQRMPAAAEASCQAVLANDPEDAEALCLLGELRADTGRFDAAQSLFRRALEVDPDCANAYFSTAAHRKMRREDEAWLQGARQLSNKRLALDDEITLRYALGKYHDDVGEYPEAFEEYRRANELGKRHGFAYDPRKFGSHVDAIRASFQAASVRDAHGASSSELPVFVLGLPRSGTSLVEQILASHPAVFGAGELHFWDAAFNAHQRAGAAGRTDAAARLVRDYLARLTARSGTAVRVVDKMPANFLYIGLIHRLFPNAKIIHVVRHPMDTCLSIYFQKFSANAAYANDLGALAHYYNEYARIMEYWRSVLPATALLEIPYENLVKNQEPWTRRMLDFVALRWEPRCLDFHETDRIVLTSSKWQVRQKLYAGSAGRWRHYERWLGTLKSALGEAALRYPH